MKEKFILSVLSVFFLILFIYKISRVWRISKDSLGENTVELRLDFWDSQKWYEENRNGLKTSYYLLVNNKRIVKLSIRNFNMEVYHNPFIYEIKEDTIKLMQLHSYKVEIAVPFKSKEPSKGVKIKILDQVDTLTQARYMEYARNMYRIEKP